MTSIRMWQAISVVGTLCGASLAAFPPAATAANTTWYVSATAAAGGDGSRADPFNNLAAVELASAAGDTIIVLPAPLSVPPLDGGISLKDDQKLIGYGPSVTGKHLTAAPRITNTTILHLGNAVVLSDGAEVRNLDLPDARRAAVFGLDAPDVTIVNNNISNSNTSCADQPKSNPFTRPTNVPGVGSTRDAHQVGVAGIQLDEFVHVTGSVTVADNLVHDGQCGDGIDVHTAGVSDVHASITGNRITRMKNGGDQDVVAAIGIASIGNSHLVAEVDRNSESYIGTSGSDSEGMYVFPFGSSTLSVKVSHNTFKHGIGWNSANGIQFTVLEGGPVADLSITDSTFDDVPGDMLEEMNWGEDSTMRLTMDRVTVTNAQGFGNVSEFPFNSGDCLNVNNGGAGNVTTVQVTRSSLTECANNGLTLANNVVNGSGNAKELSATVDGSVLRNNDAHNLYVNNLSALDTLSVKAQKSDLSHGKVVNLTFAANNGAVTTPNIDFGGGGLGSVGHNCLEKPGRRIAEAYAIDVTAKNNWWGSPAGPPPGLIVTNDATVYTDPFLTAPPKLCGDSSHGNDHGNDHGW